MKKSSPAYRTLPFSALTHQTFRTVYRKCGNRNQDEWIAPRKMLLISQSLRLEQVCLFCEPDTRLKASYLECWFAPFPGNLDLKGFLHFPYLQNKSQNDRSAFRRIKSHLPTMEYRCLGTSMIEPIPAGMRTSRLVCSSNR